MRKRLIYLGLASLLLFMSMLTGCGTQNTVNDQKKIATEQTKSTSEESSNNSSEESTDAQDENTDPLGKYEEPIEITAVIGHNAPEDPSTPPGTTPENHTWVKLCEDVLNIKLKFKWTVPLDQYDQKFMLAVSSNDLPDIMQVEPNIYQMFKENEVVADISGAYEKYASPALKETVEADGGKALESCRRGGELLALPAYADVNQFLQLLWIRTDWMKNVNMQPPKTIDELELLMEAFVKQDPDKNNKDDTYGLAINKEVISWGCDLRGFFNGFNAYPNAYQFSTWIGKGDGNLVAADIQPEMKDALARLQSMYNKDLIDKEFAIKDINKVCEDLVAGKIGMVYGEWWFSAWPLNLTMDNDPKAEWACYELPTLDGGAANYSTDKLSISTYKVVNKQCKNPEAAIKMMNLYLDLSEEKYGDLIKPEKGFVYNWVPLRPYYPMLNEWQYNAIHQALKENKTTLGESEG